MQRVEYFLNTSGLCLWEHIWDNCPVKLGPHRLVFSEIPKSKIDKFDTKKIRALLDPDLKVLSLS